jgi:hypothetical protein
MSMTIKGTIKKMFDTKQVSEKFSKREFVVSTDEGKYSQTILVQATGDRIQLLNGLGEGDQVSVEANLRGREWASPSGEVKYFVSVEMWKLDVTSKGAGGSSMNSGGGDSDSIPF